MLYLIYYKVGKVMAVYSAGQVNIPPPKEIVADAPILPFCLLGNEVFGLKAWLTTPYLGKSAGNLSYSQEIFNYRHSLARRIVKNAFGILVARWTILKTTLEVSIPTVAKLLKRRFIYIITVFKNKKVNHQRSYSYIPLHVNDTIDVLQRSRAPNPTLMAK